MRVIGSASVVSGKFFQIRRGDFESKHFEGRSPKSRLLQQSRSGKRSEGSRNGESRLSHHMIAYDFFALDKLWHILGYELIISHGVKVQ